MSSELLCGLSALLLGFLVLLRRWGWRALLPWRRAVVAGAALRDAEPPVSAAVIRPPPVQAEPPSPAQVTPPPPAPAPGLQAPQREDPATVPWDAAAPGPNELRLGMEEMGRLLMVGKLDEAQLLADELARRLPIELGLDLDFGHGPRAAAHTTQGARGLHREGWAKIPYQLLRPPFRATHIVLYQLIQGFERRNPDGAKRGCTAALATIIEAWPGKGITKRWAQILLSDLKEHGWVIERPAPVSLRCRPGRVLWTVLAEEWQDPRQVDPQLDLPLPTEDTGTTLSETEHPSRDQMGDPTIAGAIPRSQERSHDRTGDPPITQPKRSSSDGYHTDQTPTRVDDSAGAGAGAGASVPSGPQPAKREAATRPPQDGPCASDQLRAGMALPSALAGRTLSDWLWKRYSLEELTEAVKLIEDSYAKHPDRLISLSKAIAGYFRAKQEGRPWQKRGGDRRAASVIADAPATGKPFEAELPAVDPGSTWGQVLSRLAPRVGPGAVGMCLGRLKATEDRTTLALLAPDRFVRDRFAEEYEVLVRAELAALGRGAMKLIIEHERPT